MLCQGRGSAANSAVCYALGITAVDPIGDESAVRALHVRGARRDSRHRHRLRAPRPREGHPVRLRALRPHQRRDGRRGDHLSHALGDSRRRQSVGSWPSRRCAKDRRAESLADRRRHAIATATLRVARRRLRPRYDFTDYDAIPATSGPANIAVSARSASCSSRSAGASTTFRATWASIPAAW